MRDQDFSLQTHSDRADECRGRTRKLQQNLTQFHMFYEFCVCGCLQYNAVRQLNVKWIYTTQRLEFLLMHSCILDFHNMQVCSSSRFKLNFFFLWFWVVYYKVTWNLSPSLQAAFVWASFFWIHPFTTNCSSETVRCWGRVHVGRP